MNLKARLASIIENNARAVVRASSAVGTFTRSRWQVTSLWLRGNCSLRWFLFQLVGLIGIYASFRRWPKMPVGFAIGAAGVVAAGMTLRDGHWKAVEKFLWIVIVSALWGMDAHNIFREQETHDTEQNAMSDSLKDTQVKLGETQSKLSAAISQLDVISKNQSKTLELTTENLNQLTGGGDFCYIDFTHFVDGPRLINAGRYPLHAISVTIKDFAEGKKLWDKIPQAQFHPEWDLQRD